MIEPTASQGGPDEIVPFLLERIRRGRCILLLGPGVAIDPARPEAEALGLELAARLADDAEVRAAGLVSERDRRNLRYVAEAFERAHDRDEIEKRARAFYGGLPDAATELHRNLAALPFSLCVTTSPDAMMQTAFRLAGKQPRLAHYNFRRQLDEPAPGTEGEPLVYQLYGSTADPESLVLTETDLVDFLVGVVKNEPALPRWMRALIGKKSTEFLFLGVGFQNWYVRVLLHVLGVMEVHERPAYALEDRTFFEHPECAQNVGFFRRSGGGIKFFELGWNALAARLRAAHEVPPPAAAAAPPAAGPLAFLSYASEDEPSVSALAAELERRGVQVWQDRQRLRGGDRWEQALKHVIGKEVNYFVPVQSQRMVARAEGVFYQEIRWALGRQERMPDRARFVVPATVDGATLESLREVFHVVDLRPGAGVEALASAILEDWSLRARATAA